MPTLVAAYQVNSAGSDQTTLVTPTFTPGGSEVLVVKAGANRGDAGQFPTPTGGGLTYALQRHDESASHDRVALWTATVGTSPGSMSVSLGAPGATNSNHSMIVERWSSARLAATPASVLTTGAASTPSTTLTTTGANSVISWINSDWNGLDPTSRAYITTSAVPVEDGLYYVAPSGTAAVNEYAHQSARSASSQTFGLSAPGGQNWTLIGVELLDSVGQLTATDSAGLRTATDQGTGQLTATDKAGGPS